MLRKTVFLLITLACAGCSLSPHSEGNDMSVTMVAYANALRWQGFDQAVKYVDPETLKEHPVTPLDLERYKQVRVVSYMEQNPVPAGPHEVSQIVEIGILNINTQAERQIVDRQLWRYDEKTKHWHIVSGLPDITQR
jgi:hypothetical protein